jgi:hypothetical protein
MKLNEKMLTAMRKATELLQREGPGASTSAIQRTLQRLMPAKDLAKGWAEKAQPSSALPLVAAGSAAGLDRFAALRMYERYDWGRLARFHVLDDRQYRSNHACPKAGRGGSNSVAAGCS